MSGSDIHPERAYRDPEFMNSPEARSLRILAEYLEPQERFEDFNIKDTILFFGSARLLPRCRPPASTAAMSPAPKRRWPCRAITRTPASWPGA